MHAFGLKLLFNKKDQTLGRREGYNHNRTQSEPTINREHEERTYETLCDEIDRNQNNTM